MSSQFIAAAASVALIGTGFASVGGTRSIEALPAFNATLVANGEGAKEEKCRVDVFRTGTAGTADIRRYVENNGQCVCTVTTGEKPANGSAEEIVVNLVRDRECTGAPAPANIGSQVSTAAAGGGGSGVVLPVLVTTVGAAGLAVAVGNKSKG